VGHDRLGDSYTLTELVTAVQFLRNSSGRPVTTTERVRDYDEPGDQRLSKASDWIFPDVHLSLQESKGPISVERIQKDVEEMMKGIEKVKILSKRLNRPLMLKIVTFPRSGLPGASPDLQREFFQVAIERFHDPYSGLRAGSSFVVSSAFDNQWKRTPPFKPWDRYTGLLSDHGIPFPAGKLVTERWP
jgi:exo-beta-1,3-glucanase (GH17 family)